MVIFKRLNFLKGVSFFILFSICSVLSYAYAQGAIYKEIMPEEAYSLIQKQKENPDFMIIDVRTPEEFETERIMGAVNINIRSKSFEDDVKALQRDKIYLIYCRSGNRSGKALALFKHLGFNHVYNMAEGINGWLKAGYPVIR